MNSAPKKRQWRNSTQMELIVTYSIVFLVLIIALTVSLYTGFSTRMRESSVQESAKLLEQTGKSLEDYLHNMRRTAYAIYYNVIKSKDIAVDSFNSEMSLLYQANRDSLVSVALYRSDGTLVAASPNAVEKKDVDAKEQEWFEEAMRQMENQHFSNPHVQNLFDNPGYQYHWVVSLSEAVNMTENGNYVPGVLLVDMSYTAIKEKMDDVNSGRSGNSYIYLRDPLGNIIYHDGRCRYDQLYRLEDGIRHSQREHVCLAVQHKGVCRNDHSGGNIGRIPCQPNRCGTYFQTLDPSFRYHPKPRKRCGS